MTSQKQIDGTGSPQVTTRATLINDRINSPSYSEVFSIVAGTGSNKGSLLAYTDILCHDSSYFQKSRSERWASHNDRTTTIEAVDFKTFDLYYHWKISGKIDLTRLQRTVKGEDEFAKSQFEIRERIKLYVAGEYFEDGSQLSNQVMDELIVQLGRWNTLQSSPFTNSSIATYVWDNTGTESTLRQFAIDSCASTATRKSLKDNAVFPVGFTHEILLRAIDFRGLGSSATAPQLTSRCKYHVHKGENASTDKEKCLASTEQQPPSTQPTIAASAGTKRRLSAASENEGRNNRGRGGIGRGGRSGFIRG
ncbi:hypothetical protein LTR56_003005 [Elasticomyces elasticus]|nr:hypothetical protein LTR56_003005 [Elasticomyces elasticus]KAK3662068.1 hypothetical protein LTR22_007040 [Elasticomyces elasticus]KAK4927570.1 hypothetical protein LTR49_005711 [Elasticomyces elasticus]KAK5753217.1 hypothetical protein LTS12_016684 [Elasticomyces elasticus]